MRAVFFGGPCGVQERIVNGDQQLRDMKMPDGKMVRYELLFRYEDTLFYSHELSLWQIMDLLVNDYLGVNDEP